MRLLLSLFISCLVITLMPAIVDARCVEKEWDPGDFDYEMESKGSCRCCYGQFCRTGTKIEFWEPHRVIETVKDPYCSPTASESELLDEDSDDEEITGDTDILERLELGGTHSGHSNTEDATVFAQVHYLNHDDMVEIIRGFDQECWEFSDPGQEYISEDDDEWQALYSSDWWPEAEKFATLPLIEACIADATSAQFGYPIDALYWCMGSWGLLFNMNGHLNQDEYTTGNAGLAARLIAHMGRRVMLWNAATVTCYAIPMQFWMKSYFKLQPLRPTERDMRIPIGMAPEFWGEDLNKLEDGDNFAWLLWRKRVCCSSDESRDDDSDDGGSGDDNPGGDTP